MYTIFLFCVNSKFKGPFTLYSVPNSSDGLIFVKDGHFFDKNTGAKMGKTQVLVILSSFCDLVHAESVVDLFAKQLNNARERAQNHK